jgi:protein-tyrosine kinase
MTSHRFAVAPVAPPIRDGAETPKIVEQIVSLGAPSSFAADQYRALRHVVERLRIEAGLQVLAVSSAAPGDGKTVTALNLAGALAQASESRVLVIDADLRRPSVSEYLGLNRRLPGLADALREPEYTLPAVVRRLEGFNLSVLPAGPPQIAPYELLNSPRLEELLKDARRHFDCIVIDTPPCVPLPDCRLIERWVDGFLVVVAAHRTPRERLAEALNTLDPAKVIAIVYNADDHSVSEYYGYYGYYHGPRSHGLHVPWWRRLLGGGARPSIR